MTTGMVQDNMKKKKITIDKIEYLGKDKENYFHFNLRGSVQEHI